MRLYRLILILFLMFISWEVFSQSFLNLTNYTCYYKRGIVSDNQKINNSIINGYNNGFCFSLSRFPKGNKPWHSIYNYPETGFDFQYVSIGNSKEIGDLFAFSHYIDFNLFNKHKIDLDFKMGLGMAIVTRTFDPSDNQKNIFFSKPVNFYFQFALSAEYPIWEKHQLFLSSGIQLEHASNGETKLPNSGISASNVYIGISKKSQVRSNEDYHPDMIKIKKFRISLLPTMGRKEYWQYGSEKYLELSLSSDILYAINRKQYLGIGFDVFYDETRKVYSNHNLEPVKTNSEALSGGVHLTHQFNLYPLFIVYKKGINLINKENLNSTTYNLLGLKYNVSPHFYFIMYHKSHGFFYGDNIQWGMGFEL